jgi:hypothetical protein
VPPLGINALALQLYKCMHVYTHTHTWREVRGVTYVCMCVCVYVCVYTQTHKTWREVRGVALYLRYNCMYVCRYIRMYKCIHTHTHA